MQLNPGADGNVDLILTGALNEGLTLFPASSGFTIFSKDNKAVAIANKYGLDVYAITSEEEQMVLNEAKAEALIQIFKEVW